MSTPTPLPDNAACPRCGGAFHCGAGEGWCACFGTRLGEALKRELAARWPGQCLCLRCVAELARDDPGSHVMERPISPLAPPLMDV